MKEEISKSRFMDRFKEMGREWQFSYDGLSALYDYLEELDENYELDVIALCCEYAEYKSLEDFQKDYDKQKYPDLESIRNSTALIDVEGGGFIIQGF